jgi:trimethylamine--corrinoid protein Co-methyltransferase
MLPRAVALVREAGGFAHGDRVRIPRELVEWALQTAPRSVTLCDRYGAPALTLDGTATAYGPGSDCLHILDHRTGERRAPVLADVIDGLRLADALEGIDFVMSMFLPGDVDQRSADRHQMRVLLSHSAKPIVFVSYDMSGCRDAVAMAEAVAGGRQALGDRPFICCYINTATGLLHNREALEKLLFLAERGLPLLYAPGSQAGMSSPATPAGSVAMVTAGMLTGLVVAELAREGTPFILKGWGGGGLDMRTMVYGYAGPDQRATALALARFYDLPSFALAGASDAKMVDQQAAAEAALTLAVETLAGADLVHDLGYLESGLTGSLAQLAVCEEIVRWLRHLTREIDVGEEGLALDTIDEVGPDGQFLMAGHTLAHFREQWYPRLFERQTYETWLGVGGPDLAQRAAARVDELLARPLGEPSPVDDELLAIVQAAERSQDRV